MLDRPGLLPEESYRETTEAWLAAFDAALANRSAAELSPLFVADSHWRNLFGLSWHFATFSGNAKVTAELLARSAEAGAGEFRLDTARLAPRAAKVAGRDVSEAIFTFETAGGPGYAPPPLRFGTFSHKGRRDVSASLSRRHCERSEAIHSFSLRRYGLLRCARNDEWIDLRVSNGGHASLPPSLFELRRDKLPAPHESSSASAEKCAGGTGIGNFSYCFGKFTGR